MYRNSIKVAEIVQKRTRSYKNVQNRSNPNLHSRNTLFWLKKWLKWVLWELTFWFSLGLCEKCTRCPYLSLLSDKKSFKVDNEVKIIASMLQTDVFKEQNRCWSFSFVKLHGFTIKRTKNCY